MQFQFKDPTLLHMKFLNLNNREAACPEDCKFIVSYHFLAVKTLLFNANFFFNINCLGEE